MVRLNWAKRKATILDEVVERVYVALKMSADLVSDPALAVRSMSEGADGLRRSLVGLLAAEAVAAVLVVLLLGPCLAAARPALRI
jgi:hypothetical protein